MIPLIDDRVFIITSLSEALEIYGAEWTSEVLGTFRSAHDSATEAFLKEKAIDMESGTSRGRTLPSPRTMSGSWDTSHSASSA